MLKFTPVIGTKAEGGPMDAAFWLSFSPMAPFFGVKYRYADMFKFEPVFPAKKAEAAVAEKPAAKAPAKKAKAAAKPKAAPTPVVEPVVETVVEAVVEAAPEPVAEPDVEIAVEAVIDEVLELVETPAADRPATLFDAPPATVDDLKLIKGVGPKLEGMLNGLGIYTFEQIAGFSVSELQWVDENLTSFKGRAFRDDWIAQAKELLTQ